MGLLNLLLLACCGFVALPLFYLVHVSYFTFAAKVACLCNFVKVYCYGVAVIILQAALTAHFLGDDCAIQLYLLCMLLVAHYIFVTSYRRTVKVLFLTLSSIVIVSAYLIIDEFLDFWIKPHQLISDLTEIFFTLINAAGALTLFTFACSVFVSSFQHEFRRLNDLNTGLNEAVVHDKLTGLLNRTGLERKLSWLRQHKLIGGDKPYTVVMGDIDFFKTVNDSYGHDAGDLVLQRISVYLNGYVNEHFYLCRWGGEEFLIVILSKLESAVAVVEELRSQIEEMVIPFYNKELKVTMSFGLCGSQDEEKFTEMVRLADGELYRAKRSGRNRVSYTTLEDQSSPSGT